MNSRKNKILFLCALSLIFWAGLSAFSPACAQEVVRLTERTTEITPVGAESPTNSPIPPSAQSFMPANEAVRINAEISSNEPAVPSPAPLEPTSNPQTPGSFTMPTSQPSATQEITYPTDDIRSAIYGPAPSNPDPYVAGDTTVHSVPYLTDTYTDPAARPILEPAQPIQEPNTNYYMPDPMFNDQQPAAGETVVSAPDAIRVNGMFVGEPSEAPDMYVFRETVNLPDNTPENVLASSDSRTFGAAEQEQTTQAIKTDAPQDTQNIAVEQQIKNENAQIESEPSTIRTTTAVENIRTAEAAARSLKRQLKGISEGVGGFANAAVLSFENLFVKSVTAKKQDYMQFEQKAENDQSKLRKKLPLLKDILSRDIITMIDANDMVDTVPFGFPVPFIPTDAHSDPVKAQVVIGKVQIQNPSANRIATVKSSYYPCIISKNTEFIDYLKPINDNLVKNGLSPPQGFLHSLLYSILSLLKGLVHSTILHICTRFTAACQSILLQLYFIAGWPARFNLLSLNHSFILLCILFLIAQSTSYRKFKNRRIAGFFALCQFFGFNDVFVVLPNFKGGHHE